MSKVGIRTPDLRVSSDNKHTTRRLTHFFRDHSEVLRSVPMSSQQSQSNQSIAFVQHQFVLFWSVFSSYYEATLKHILVGVDQLNVENMYR